MQRLGAPTDYVKDARGQATLALVKNSQPTPSCDAGVARLHGWCADPSPCPPGEGASGAAVQSTNVHLGVDEALGLEAVGSALTA